MITVTYLANPIRVAVANSGNGRFHFCIRELGSVPYRAYLLPAAVLTRIAHYVGRTDAIIPEMGRVEDVNIRTLTPGQILNVFYDAPPTQPLEQAAQAAQNLWATTATGFWDLVGTTNP